MQDFYIGWVTDSNQRGAWFESHFLHFTNLSYTNIQICLGTGQRKKVFAPHCQWSRPGHPKNLNRPLQKIYNFRSIDILDKHILCIFSILKAFQDIQENCVVTSVKMVLFGWS